MPATEFIVIAAGQKAAALETLEDHGSLLVRRVVDRNDELSEAIFDLAADGQTEWTLEDWDTLVAELTGSNLTVDDWLILYT